MLGQLCHILHMYISNMHTLFISCISLLPISSPSPLTQEVADTGQEDSFNQINIRDKIVEDLGMDKKPDVEHVCSFVILPLYYLAAKIIQFKSYAIKT